MSNRSTKKMKVEHDTSPATTNTSFQQWSSPQIPIDPALQQQQPQQMPPYAYPSTSHYQQTAYGGHYQPYAPMAPHQHQQPAPARQSSQSNAVDTADVATLNDALGSAGVDLRAEEETLQRSHEQHQFYRPQEDRSRKQPSNLSFETQFLGKTMRDIGTQHKISKVPDDSINYLAIALRIRLQELISAMVAAATHRTETQHDRPAGLYEDGSPMWSLVVRRDVGKQLAALEKIEREEETKIRRERQERKENMAAHAAGLAAQAAGTSTADGGGFDDEMGSGKKSKKKKDGPGVTAKNMPEDVRKKMSNAVASQAAGLGSKYAWMTAANANAPPPKPKPSASSGTPAGTTTPSTTGGSWARPYFQNSKTTPPAPALEVDTRMAVTIRDAMFVIEKERGHGGGRGSARGWV